jgi:hypothetical protein
MTDGHVSDTPPHRASEDGRAALLERLRQRIGGGGFSGHPQSDSGLHRRNFEDLLGRVGPKRLIELLEMRPGGGASLIGLWLAAQAACRHGELVVIDPSATFYPPAAVAWGIDARRLLVVHPSTPRDALAAAEMALRSPAASAVWAQLGKIDGRVYRRLLLAAEAGSACGVFVREARYEADPSWADVQLLVEPLATPTDPVAPFQVRVIRRRNRHGPAGGEATLAIDWRTGELRDATHTDASHAPNALYLAAGMAGAAQPA